ncbi:MAG: hypothetical protein L3K16_09755, partial [Thermoplasmata archaeon]|nr:hypothetical protein [Thermoplasmata archaeon]
APENSAVHVRRPVAKYWIRGSLVTLRAKGAVPAEFVGDGWGIAGKSGGAWQLRPEEFDDKVEEFATFIARIAGRFTLDYVRHMPSRVDDRWLKSVFVHLLLNSISTSKPEEAEVREFPYI